MNAPRLAALDALRALAMLWMTVYHLCFDLNSFGLIKQDFYHDPSWTWQRTLIVSLFLFCAGMGQTVALAEQQNWRRFWRRWRQLAACALLVSAGSWLLYPQSFIYFGVLHGMALMLIVARLSAPCGAWLWLMGGLAISAKFFAAYLLTRYADSAVQAVMNAPMLNWLGLITHLPVTEDYVPVLPWLGVMWWGMAAGRALLNRHSEALRRPLPSGLLTLATLGRWSLSYYMLHQPVLLAALFGLIWLFK